MRHKEWSTATQNSDELRVTTRALETYLQVTSQHQSDGKESYGESVKCEYEIHYMASSKDPTSSTDRTKTGDGTSTVKILLMKDQGSKLLTDVGSSTRTQN